MVIFHSYVSLPEGSIKIVAIKNIEKIDTSLNVTESPIQVSFSSYIPLHAWIYWTCSQLYHHISTISSLSQWTGFFSIT
jgi:hypothetical protein